MLQRIVNQAGWRKKVFLEKGEEAWDYFITPDTWHEATKGFDPKTAAKTLAERGYLLPGGDGKNSGRVTPPGHGRQRAYCISHTIFGGGDE